MKDTPVFEWWFVCIAVFNSSVTTAASLCSISEAARWIFTMAAAVCWFLLGIVAAWNFLIWAENQEDGSDLITPCRD